jgi:hypothetical protein
MLGISLSKVNSEATHFSSNNQKQVFLLLKVNFNSKIKTKVLWDSLQVVLINNLLLDQLINKLLQVYLEHHRHSLPKLVICLEAQLNYLLSLNLAPYLEELLNHKINQERTYLYRAILVLFLVNSNQINKVISLEDLQLKANQPQVYFRRVKLDKLEEVSLVIHLRVVYFLKLNKLNHLLS